MNGAGLVDVKTKILRASLRLSDASAALEMMRQAFGAYCAIVAELGDTERSKAWEDVHKCLKRFENTQGFETEFEFIIGSSVKSD
jgi:hypothetical protein